MGIMAWLLSRGADKQLKQYRAIVEQINAKESDYQRMSDEELKSQTTIFKNKLENGSTLDDILVDAFAVVREASVRTLGMRHYDEQLIAALALHENMIAEASTGSGKTLACTPAVYLNALEGYGVHVVTVNDYLATRDAKQMGNIYSFLGLSCACLTNDMIPFFRKQAYLADITYGTNSEFGFDYLRDNMATDPKYRMQRGHNFAIVDEVDSILIDEARTPLIISGEGEGADEIYKSFANAMKGLQENIDYVLQNALKANFLFTKDIDYLVNDAGEVLIVDEFTGRVLPGRRYSEGLHQAIEAKEGVKIQSENETLATITLQNYFRMYNKLAGMTGTAMTEDAEFRATYNLPVMAIPDHKPCIREDKHDVIFATVADKYEAIAREVKIRHNNGQPVLIGTTSIESSEKLSRQLKKHGIPHNVLNAKHHAQEAYIVAQAGRFGAVTVATNMAGRGTDIMLGGNSEMLAETLLMAYPKDENGNYAPESIAEANAAAKEICKKEAPLVKEAGGLLVIGSERHESRRIDNQLRGRSGRQGDPGETRFYLSLEDDLVRKFAGEKAEKARQNLIASGCGPDDPLESRTLTKLIEGAQHTIEEINFASRKNVLEYDDVLNRQRQAIYDERNSILDGADLISETKNIIEQLADVKVNKLEGDLDSIVAWTMTMTPKDELPTFTNETTNDAKAKLIQNWLQNLFDAKVTELGEDVASRITTQVLLRVIDTRWRIYLQEMDYLKTGIGLRGFGQRDPLVEYKHEAYDGFENLVATMYEDYIRSMLNVEVRVERPDIDALKAKITD